MISRYLLSALSLVLLLTGADVRGQDSAVTLPQWIWSSGNPGPEDKVYLRKKLAIPATTRRAILVASGDNRVEVFLNENKRGPKGQSWERPVVEEVTDQLRRGGENLIAVTAENQGGIGGVFVLLELTDLDGTKTRHVSDGTWIASNKAAKGWSTMAYDTDGANWAAAVKVRDFGAAPWGKVDPAALADLLDLRVPQATPVEDIGLVDGFKAELLYSVPKADQGSWVAMTIDDKHRLIVSDQYGALYRITIPADGSAIPEKNVEKIPVDIGGAQGLLYAFDSLYAVLNTAEHGGRGLYRISDSDGDDQFDKKEQLRKFDEIGGEHGPHAVVLAPDGKSLYVVVGNQTPVTEVDTSLIPRVWGEDLLLESPIGRGFMKGTKAPGGWVARTDPGGKTWELVATGFRNQYDVAFNRNGDAFTYDADMEWDIGTPWYRPTRINHIASGGEFGWRTCGGKWPAHYPDSLPAVVNIGPGSPTGVSFGYGAKFPARYQNAFFAADWSYGKLYAVHMEPDGATYKAEVEEFMSAQPLPLTDLLVNPADGALYVAIGGRRVQSGLYRVTYTGPDSTEPAPAETLTEAHQLRRKLETFHRSDPAALEAAWPHLGSGDRFIRYAARTAVEHQPVAQWREKALAEPDPEALINAMIALTRHGETDLQDRVVEALHRLPFDSLSARQRLDLVRAYSLAFTRFGEGSPAVRESVAKRLIDAMPFGNPQIDPEALQLLVYLDRPEAAALGIKLLKSAPLQEEQIAYVKSLRHLARGWTIETRGELFKWFTRAKAYRGGASFGLFMEEMKADVLKHTPEADQITLKEIIEAEPTAQRVFTAEPRAFVQAWQVTDFDDVISVGLEGNRDFQNGRRMFGAASCFACHQFNQEGGAIGPDLTSVRGKFSPRDLLESITDPGKEISDQYGQMIFEMKDGTIVTGRIMNLSGDNVQVNTNMMNPDEITPVDRKRLKSMKESPVSMMPPGLLNTLGKDDVLDLLAYMLSGGNEEDPLFAH